MRDFPGLARSPAREGHARECAHIHFNGAGGNVTAGKYNDGSKPTAPVLAGRAAGRRHEKGLGKHRENAVTADDIAWANR